MKLLNTSQKELGVEMLKEDGNNEFVPFYQSIGVQSKSLSIDVSSNILEE